MVRHFSHGHSLGPFEVEKEEGLVCSCCELELTGSAYRCNARSKASSPLDCYSFYLHKSCLKLQREIQHASHPQHPLTLFPIPPGSSLGMFTCGACDRYGFGFTYNCQACDINLHVRCSSFPETLNRPDLHQHSLSLVFQVEEDEKDDKDEDEDEDDREVGCGVCQSSYFKEECWAYRCKDCRCVVHLECTTANDDDEEEAAKDQEEDEEEVREEEEEEDEEKEEDEGKEEDEEEEEENEEAEEKEDEEAEDDGEETEEDSDSIIARNIERNAVLQMKLYNQNARRMMMQQQKMMNSIRTPFPY